MMAAGIDARAEAELAAVMFRLRAERDAEQARVLERDRRLAANASCGHVPIRSEGIGGGAVRVTCRKCGINWVTVPV